MPLSRKTASEFLAKLRNGIVSRTKRFDTGYGPIKDAFLLPTAAVLEDEHNNELRPTSLLISLQNDEEFSEEDLDSLVFNEDITRPEGANAVVTLRFARSTAFSSSETGLLQRGHPIGTSADESSGQAVTFVITETKDKSSAVAVLNTDTNRTEYVVEIPSVCVIQGAVGLVGPDRINRPLRPLVGWETVTNPEASREGRDRYSQSELIELYLLAVGSRQLSVPQGNELYVRNNFGAVEDMNEVSGTNVLLTRAGTDAGAVDAYIKGTSALTKTDQVTFLGLGQKLILSTPPVVSITSVVRVSDSEEFDEDVDYEVRLDTSGVGGSIRARDGIRFIPTSDPVPDVGDLISITYTYNELIRDLQTDAEDDRVKVDGRDLLYRMATQVEVYISAALTVKTGFVFATIKAAAETALLDYVNDLGMKKNVEESDLQKVVRGIAGVDNFVFSRLTDDESSIEAGDIVLGENEFPNLELANLVIS